MSASRIRSLILLILALTAALLAAAVLPGRTAMTRERQEMLQSLRTLARKQSVSLELSELPESETLYTVEISGAPEQFVRTLLGPDVVLSADSTRFEQHYTGASGSAVFELTGAFTAEPAASAPFRDPLRNTEKLLQTLQLQTDALTYLHDGEGSYEISAGQRLLGVPVFGSRVSFVYDGGVLRRVTGVCYPDEDRLARVSEEPCISCADAILAFLGSRDTLGWLGSRITAVTQGYVFSETAAGAFLVPAWRIETDTGVFRVSGVTAEVRPED